MVLSQPHIFPRTNGERPSLFWHPTRRILHDPDVRPVLIHGSHRCGVQFWIASAPSFAASPTGNRHPFGNSRARGRADADTAATQRGTIWSGQPYLACDPGTARPGPKRRPDGHGGNA